MQILEDSSSTVTFVPILAYTDPSSSPITPPPMHTIFFGMVFDSNAPVEDTITFSSNSEPGKGIGSDPVAIIMFFAFISLIPPLFN